MFKIPRLRNSPRLMINLTAMAALVSLLSFQNCAPGFESMDNEGVIELQSLTPDQEEPAEVSVFKTSYEPLVMDRILLSSLLKDIFGEDVLNFGSARRAQSAVNFGAPCSIYLNQEMIDPTDRSKRTNTKPFDRCNIRSAALVTAPMDPKTTVVRGAEIPHICSDAVNNSTMLTHAMKKIDASAAVPALNTANLKKAFKLFYREKPDPETPLLQSLALMQTGNAASAADWRNVIYSICASGHWQVL